MELVREWRTDKYLRRLEAVMIAADTDRMLLISGNGDVIEPDGVVLAIGSGGVAAQAAAQALMDHTQMDVVDVVQAAMKIASDICIYTNDTLTMEEL